MTFLEALKTGLPLRRRSWWNGQAGNRWLVLDAEGTWWWRHGGEASPPRRVDLFAEDWEVR